MNAQNIVEALRYLLEKEQSRLLAEGEKKNISPERLGEIGDEVREIEEMVDMAREGWEEI
jgi:hypothetical protein